MNLLDLAVKVSLDDQVTGKLGGIGSKAKSALGTVAKVGAAATAAVAGGVGALGKAALESYASYEQLVGGVDKLFGEASGQLQQYAAEAYKTSGMSANQYMEQATSFSAALIQSLGGDTAKAAEQADVAMRAMSDNVNVFGSNMEDVQNAFQGFAKQNYTMLDNLKLGYGGTKEEMQRLIDDANAYAESIGQASDLSIDSFSDIVTAIELVQEQQGIAGTTAKEAATTIEGSVNMAKAAWENWLTELGKDNNDMGELTTQLVESVTTAAGNIIPRFAAIATAAATALSETLPSAVEQLAASAGDYASQLGESLLSLFTTAVNVIMEYLPGAAQGLVEMLSGALIEGGPDILAGAGDMLLSLVQAVTDVLPMAVEALSTLVTSLAEYLVEHMDEMLESALELIGTILTAIADNGPDILAALALVLASMLVAIGNKVGEFFDKGLEIIKGMWDGAKDKFNEVKDWVAGIPGKILNALGDLGSLLWDAGASVLSGFWNGLKSKWESVKGWFSDITSSIPSLKGPADKDARLLVENGRLIIGGLSNGLADAWSGVERQLAGYTAEFGGMSFSAPALATAGAPGGGAPTYNVYLDGSLLQVDSRINDKLSDFVDAVLGSYGR